MKTIFIVDGNDASLLLTKKALEAHYRVLTLLSAAKLFKLLEKIIPDLILLDIEIPEMDGFKALQTLKSSNLYKNIPVIFLTSHREEEYEALGFKLGAADFISKPFLTPVLLNRIKTHLQIDSLIRDRNRKIEQLHNSIMRVLAHVVEGRDKDTTGHNNRTAAYVKILIKGMEEYGVYTDELRGWNIEKIAFSSQLHDIGKICILDTILNKRDKLSDEEYERMKCHTTEGASIIDRIMNQTGEEEFLSNAKLFAEYHHERWDGKGYPHGLKKTDIPLHGRIMAIVDAYDALVSKRPYKEAYTNEEAVNIILANAGKQFDPKIVKVFLNVQDQLKEAINSLEFVMQ